MSHNRPLNNKKKSKENQKLARKTKNKKIKNKENQEQGKSRANELNTNDTKLIKAYL